MTRQEINKMLKDGWKVHNMRPANRKSNVRPLQCWVKTTNGKKV
jgi:hypothetical protein